MKTKMASLDYMNPGILDMLLKIDNDVGSLGSLEKTGLPKMLNDTPLLKCR